MNHKERAEILRQCRYVFECCFKYMSSWGLYVFSPLHHYLFQVLSVRFLCWDFAPHTFHCSLKLLKWCL
jgi:hypothetical protein